MKKYIFMALLIYASSIFADIKQQTRDIISERFPQSTVTFEKFLLPESIKKSIEKQAGQKFLKNFVYLWRIEQQEQLVAYAITDAVRAKSAFMTTTILINTTGEIVQLDILNYNGDRGRKVTNIMWLEQFDGKTADDDFRLGSGVDAISGATRSAQAVARGARRWCLLAHYISSRDQK